MRLAAAHGNIVWIVKTCDLIGIDISPREMSVPFSSIERCPVEFIAECEVPAGTTVGNATWIGMNRQRARPKQKHRSRQKNQGEAGAKSRDERLIIRVPFDLRAYRIDITPIPRLYLILPVCTAAARHLNAARAATASCLDAMGDHGAGT